MPWWDTCKKGGCTPYNPNPTGASTGYGVNGYRSDLSVPLPVGTPVESPVDGIVLPQHPGNGYYSVYGNQGATGTEVDIATILPKYRFGRGLSTTTGVYNVGIVHLDTASVKPGQWVKKGDIIGTSGGQNSGGSSPTSPAVSGGPHIGLQVHDIAQWGVIKDPQILMTDLQAGGDSSFSPSQEQLDAVGVGKLPQIGTPTNPSDNPSLPAGTPCNAWDIPCVLRNLNIASFALRGAKFVIGILFIGAAVLLFVAPIGLEVAGVARGEPEITEAGIALRGRRERSGFERGVVGLARFGRARNERELAEQRRQRIIAQQARLQQTEDRLQRTAQRRAWNEFLEQVYGVQQRARRARRGGGGGGAPAPGPGAPGLGVPPAGPAGPGGGGGTPRQPRQPRAPRTPIAPVVPQTPADAAQQTITAAAPPEPPEPPAPAPAPRTTQPLPVQPGPGTGVRQPRVTTPLSNVGPRMRPSQDFGGSDTPVRTPRESSTRDTRMPWQGGPMPPAPAGAEPAKPRKAAPTPVSTPAPTGGLTPEQSKEYDELTQKGGSPGGLTPNEQDRLLELVNIEAGTPPTPKPTTEEDITNQRQKRGTFDDTLHSVSGFDKGMGAPEGVPTPPPVPTPAAPAAPTRPTPLPRQRPPQRAQITPGPALAETRRAERERSVAAFNAPRPGRRLSYENFVRQIDTAYLNGALGTARILGEANPDYYARYRRERGF